jgi:hypothetical protein
MVCERSERTIEAGLSAEAWKKLELDLGAPIALAIQAGHLRIRAIDHFAPAWTSGREVLVAVIAAGPIGDGPKNLQVFAWVWGPEYWDELLRALQGQADAGLITHDDAVALIKLRSAAVLRAKLQIIADEEGTSG